ncbi:uncharacterized protein LY89DRAFT_647570 [Mollisia scopiformis]|uniref:methionyl-tRNA formyltransferase n=1 Tax=Mollisia scopiformis TaxID=149040 RepID=A0A194X677_MOLSC|nr:uncharacterized protein LY89DRAFT_647570 [Mollisia scopiformis]KUJ15683.1 hypothetical protein LY89DRAFT_647570 [Mollisia scopiformis]
MMMPLLFIRNAWRPSRFPSSLLHQGRFYATKKISKPLRILFCGSDSFSIACLQSLHAESQKNPDFIESIDVLCRPPKLTGRGMKVLQQVPIYEAAKNLGLTIHQRDTFAGWDLPTPDGESISLIIAVSFGLFIPARLIRAVKYGGLNVHPSMLPNHRGSAPLQRLIMTNAKTTGVTLQTLDTQKFDYGIILAQRKVHIPRAASITYPELLDHMTPRAAQLLIDGMRDRVFIPPLINKGKGTYESRLPPDQLVHAPKITKEDRHINWHRNDSLTRIDRRHRALGPLWSILYVGENITKRFVFHDFEMVERPTAINQMVRKWRTGRWFMNSVEKSDPDNTASFHSQLSDDGSSQSAATLNAHQTDEESFDTWRASGEYKSDQTEDEAFASWQQFRERQLARENEASSGQNVYHMIDTVTNGEMAPVFYIEDGHAIIVAVKDGAFRVKEITVEGDQRRTAAAAMKRYRKRGMWKLQYRPVEGIDRWFAAYNPRYTDTFSRDEWIKTLSPEQREEEEDKDLWALIREEKREERKLLEGLREPVRLARSLEPEERAREEHMTKEERKRLKNDIKEQKRLKRREADELFKERNQIKEDLKKADWSPLLLEKHREFFPEAMAEARKERLRERKEKDREIAKSMKEASDAPGEEASVHLNTSEDEDQNATED